MKCKSLTECKSNSADEFIPHSWDKKEYKYKVELDQYVFVVRVRIGE
jgi:hypothetical protein